VSHEPKNYDLPNHLAKILRSPEFAAAAKQAEKSHESFQNDVGEALKKVVGELRGAELAEFENHLQAQALTAALAKFKTDVEHELKALVTKARAVELKAHEDAVAARVLKSGKVA
jgi:hypothetical protein